MQLALFDSRPLSSIPIFQDLEPGIVKEFETYHKDNPSIYRLFKQYSFTVKASGKKRFSSKAVMERIRWFYEIEKGDREFKCNNNFTSCYARLLTIDEPCFNGFFELRSSK